MASGFASSSAATLCFIIFGSPSPFGPFRPIPHAAMLWCWSDTVCETELIVAAAPTRGQAVYDVEEGVERWDESQRHAADAACALEAARQVQQQIVGQLLAMTDHFEALILQLEMAVSVHCPLLSSRLAHPVPVPRFAPFTPGGQRPWTSTARYPWRGMQPLLLRLDARAPEWAGDARADRSATNPAAIVWLGAF